MNRHSEALKSYWTSDIPWFVPTWAGGLGLHPFRKLSRAELCGVSMIKYHWNHPVCTEETDSDGVVWEVERTLRPVNIPTIADWKMHSLVMDRLDPIIQMGTCDHQKARKPPLPGCMGDEVYDLAANWRKIYKYCTIETLFTSKLEDLYNGDSGRDGVRLRRQALAFNQAIWRWLMRQPFPKGITLLTEEEVWSQKMEDFYPIIIVNSV
jgi:hypothetical protein